MLWNIPFIAAVVLMIIGLYAVLYRRNIIKIIMGLEIMEAAVNLFLIALGYRKDAVAPIFTSSPGGTMVLPTPQALTLTAIVIGLATTALLLAFAVLIYQHHNTMDSFRIRRLKE